MLVFLFVVAADVAAFFFCLGWGNGECYWTCSLSWTHLSACAHHHIQPWQGRPIGSRGTCPASSGKPLPSSCSERVFTFTLDMTGLHPVPFMFQYDGHGDFLPPMGLLVRIFFTRFSFLYLHYSIQPLSEVSGFFVCLFVCVSFVLGLRLLLVKRGWKYYVYLACLMCLALMKHLTFMLTHGLKLAILPTGKSVLLIALLVMCQVQLTGFDAFSWLRRQRRNRTCSTSASCVCINAHPLAFCVSCVLALTPDQNDDVVV